MDMTTLTDDDLDALRRDVLTELERRANLAAIPDQVRALADTYTAGGGDRNALAAALNPKETP